MELAFKNFAVMWTCNDSFLLWLKGFYLYDRRMHRAWFFRLKRKHYGANVTGGGDLPVVRLFPGGTAAVRGVVPAPRRRAGVKQELWQCRSCAFLYPIKPHHADNGNFFCKKNHIEPNPILILLEQTKIQQLTTLTLFGHFLCPMGLRPHFTRKRPLCQLRSCQQCSLPWYRECEPAQPTGSTLWAAHSGNTALHGMAKNYCALV